MAILMDLYRQNPTAVLSVVGAFVASCLTAIVAFTGVVLSNRAALKRQHADLSNSAEMAKTERDLVLKRTVYLEALEDIGVEIGKLFDLWNVQLQADPAQRGVGKVPASSFRLYLVAGEKTVQAVVELHTAFVQASVQALPLRFSYMRVVASRDRIANALTRIRDERSRHIGDLKREDLADARRTEISARVLKLDEWEAQMLERLRAGIEHLTRSALNMLTLGAKSKTAVETKVFAVVAAMRAELDVQSLGMETLKVLAAVAEESRRVTEQSIKDAQAMLPLMLDAVADAKSTTGLPDAAPSR